MKEPAPAQAEKSTATVQALLRQLLDIYDAKTLASLLVAHGESHWSPAILKRLLTSERAGRRLSEGDEEFSEGTMYLVSLEDYPLGIWFFNELGHPDGIFVEKAD